MRKHIKDAMAEHTNLTVFAAVVATLEGVTIRGHQADRTAQRIIAICQKEQQRQLKFMDAAVEKAEKGSAA